MKELRIKKQRKERRVLRTRKKIFETKAAVRLSIFASNRYTYAQLIDDLKNTTVASVSEKELKEGAALTKTQKAVELAKLLAAKAKEKKIEAVVFDKGGYKYHGRVKAFAEAAREAGLQF